MYTPPERRITKSTTTIISPIICINNFKIDQVLRRIGIIFKILLISSSSMNFHRLIVALATFEKFVLVYYYLTSFSTIVKILLLNDNYLS